MAPLQLQPAEELDPEKQPYQLRLLKAPVLGGWPLKAFISAFESSSLGATIYSAIAPASGVTQVLHGLKVPEQPLFWADTRPSEAGSETGCSPLQAETAADALQMLVQEGFLPRYTAALAAAGASPHQPASQPKEGATSQGGAGEAAGPSPQAEEAAEAVPGYNRPSILDYARAYRMGHTTPTEVAERIIAFLQRSDSKKCGWFVAWDAGEIRRQAQESEERLKAGSPRSVLEGVPFAVKDVADAAPYPTTAGTAFLAQTRDSSNEAPYVTTLREMGAILLGKTTLHEIGLGITGLNLRTGTALNPHNLGHFCGGSSSGSAAVLAAGVCPIAIGSDGGGSIRIPASFCGVVGLKPTNGRVTGRGVVEVDCTVATMGPMASCVEDATILYTVLANFDQWYTVLGEKLPVPNLPRPPPGLDSGPAPLAGAKAGIYWEWFNDSSPDVLAAANAAVELLKGAGVEVKAVTIPELEYLRVAHTVTIVSEMHHNFQAQYDDSKTRALFNPDVRIGLTTVKHWTTADYLQCQRIRQRATIHFRRAMADVDVLLVPATPITAPPIPSGALQGGNSDLGLTSQVMRYAVAANMLGFPAASVPIGTDTKGLPIGFQIIGKPWSEGTVLRWAAVLEQEVRHRHEGAPKAAAGKGSFSTSTGQPAVWLDPLTGKSSGL